MMTNAKVVDLVLPRFALADVGVSFGKSVLALFGPRLKLIEGGMQATAFTA